MMTSNERRHLNTLKLKTTTEKDIATIMSYFFDHFGEDRAFMKKGESVEHPLLEAVMSTALNALYKGSKFQQMDVSLTHLPEEGFIHGGSVVLSPMAVVTVFYFEDIDTGVMGVVSPMSGSNTEMIRFSCQTMGGSAAKRHSMN